MHQTQTRIQRRPQTKQPRRRVHLSLPTHRPRQTPPPLRLPPPALPRRRPGPGQPRRRLRHPGMGGGGDGRAAADAVPRRQRLRDFERVLLVSGLDARRREAGGCAHGRQGRFGRHQCRIGDESEGPLAHQHVAQRLVHHANRR